MDRAGLQGLQRLRLVPLHPASAAGDKPLALLLTPIRTSYQFYADGKLIGGFGYMPPKELALFSPPKVYDLPRAGEAGPRNAGHLSPYCNGEELAVEAGLPLGLIAEGSYEETHCQLASGDRLTFMSDGVVEARNTSGQLYGFDRTQQISVQSAAVIAETARHFGQEDDITVLAIQYRGAETLESGVPRVYPELAEGSRF